MKRYLCKCGCNGLAKFGNVYINGHNGKGKHYNKGKYCSEETKRKMSKAHMGCCASEETRMKISKSLMGHPGANKGKKFSKEHVERIRSALIGVKHSKERIRKNSEGNKRFCRENPKHVENRVKAMFATLKIKPNKPERRLRNRLNHLFPNEYKYVGNGDIWIGGKNPDFININGQKKIIELFGNYWHSEEVTGRTRKLEKGQRIKHFAKYGFKTLIVWQSELKDIRQLKKKLIRFDKIWGVRRNKGRLT